jgi:predicted O-methyltransferase YrrM
MITDKASASENYGEIREVARIPRDLPEPERSQAPGGSRARIVRPGLCDRDAAPGCGASSHIAMPRSFDRRPAAEFIAGIAEDVPGWSPEDQLLALSLLVSTSAHLGGDVLELGVWCGRSALVMGRAKRMSNGCVHAVDIFPEREEWQEDQDGNFAVICERNGELCGFGDEAPMWRDAFFSSVIPVYQKHGGPWNVFHQRLAKYGLERIVVPHRMSARQYYEKWEGRLSAHLVYIDGEHGYQSAMRDIEFAKRHLRPGGWLCMDDAFTCYQGIDRAIEDAILGSNEFESRHKPTRKMFVARRV